MKMSKDQTQKLVLGGLMLAALLYGYFTLLLGPLKKQQASAEARIVELGPKIEAAKAQIKRTKQLETQAPASVAVLESIHGLIPEGAPIAWFPPRMAEFFKRQGIDKVSTRLINEAAEKELPGYRRLIWTVEVPKVDFVALAIAIAGLENEEPLLSINNLQINAANDDPQHQHVLIALESIAKQ